MLVREELDVVSQSTDLADAFVVLGLELLHFLVLHLLNTNYYSKTHKASLLYRVYLSHVYIDSVGAQVVV